MRIHAGRRSVHWISVLVALCFCAVAAPAAREYRTVDIESLRITIDTDWAPRNAPGYFPARFDITNSGDERTIEIALQGSRSYRIPRGIGAGGTTSAVQSIRLAKGDHVRLTIPVPIYGDNENFRFDIRERNRVIFRFDYRSLISRWVAKDASALVVASPGSTLSTIPMRTSRAGLSGSTTMVFSSGGRGVGPPPTIGTMVATGRTGGPATTLDFNLEPSRLPTNWLGYASLRAVAIGSTEWAELSDGQKSALLTWTAGGGDLILVDGDIKTLLPSAQPEPAADSTLGRISARHLLGRVHSVPLILVGGGLTSVIDSIDRDRDLNWALPANGAPDWGTIERRGFRLRIPGIDGVPARVYLGMLLLFSVLIGPVNYWLLRRKRQQVLMVLTAPVISAVFIVLLAGYAIAGEGFRLQGRALSFTVLDQLTNQAATRATISLYAPGLTPGAGLRFGRDTAVWAIGPEGSGIRDRMDLDLTDDQYFSAGVLQARAPTNLEQVTVRAARERLTFSAADGGLTVTNGLDATILSLSYRDGNTMYRLDGSLASGSKQVMKATTFDPHRVLPEAILIPPKMFGVFQNQPSRSYLAVLDRSPFWEPGASNLSERGSVHVVLGWPEGQR